MSADSSPEPSPKSSREPSREPSPEPEEPLLRLPPSLSLPADQEPAIEAPKLPARKQRYRKPEEAADEGESEPSPDEAALLNALQAVRQQRKQSSESSAAPSARTINRFVPRAAAAHPSAAPPAAAPDDVPRPPGALKPVLPKFRPWTFGETASPWERDRNPWLRRTLYCTGAVVLTVVAFLAGRDQAPQPATAGVSKAHNANDQAAPWPSAEIDLFVKALAADHAGNLATAARLIDQLAKDVPLSPALLAYRETITTRQGDFLEADGNLARLLAANTSPLALAKINAARGFNFVRARQSESAIGCFAAIAVEDPLDVANLLHWGETLRRNGNLTGASAKFQDALSRLPATTSPYVEAQREFIAYERRLTQVENGQDAGWQPELDERLGEPVPSGYWLLTAAAVALEKGDLPAAVAALNKAQTVFSPAQFSALLGDYFFHSFASHPELKAFPIIATPEQVKARWASMDYFIDP